MAPFQAAANKVSLAFATTTELSSVESCRQFRANYADWPEAVSQLSAAYDLEARLALEDAQASAATKDFDDFRTRYLEPRWQEQSHKAEIAAMLAPFLASAQVGELLPDERIDLFLDRYRSHPHLHMAASGYAEKFWKAAKLTQNAAGYELYSTLFPTTSRAGKAGSLARSISWDTALERGSPDSFLRFVRHFPGDSRVALAESYYYRLQRLNELSRLWPRAIIQQSRKLGSGKTELHIDVRDCFPLCQ